MVFGGCSHIHTVKLTNIVNPNNGFLACGICGKDINSAQDYKVTNLKWIPVMTVGFILSQQTGINVMNAEVQNLGVMKSNVI